MIQVQDKVILERMYQVKYFGTHCNILQHTATHCNALQHTATHCAPFFSFFLSWVSKTQPNHWTKQIMRCKNMLLCAAVCCSVLQRIAVCCRRGGCVLLCSIKPILGNRYVRSRGFIVSEPRETHPQSEIADVPTLPCPPLDNLGCPDPHPPP